MAYQPKSYRKFVATAATATLVAGAVAPFASAADASKFTDVSTSYKEAVDFVVSKGAKGTSETTFGVSNNIKRGDAAVLLVQVLELDTKAAPAAGFKDVNTRLAPYINALKEADITNGKTETTFAPDALITRGELAKWIAKGFGLEGSGKVDFTDVSTNYSDAVSALVENGVTKGASETTFGTTANAKRGDYAKFLFAAASVEVGPQVVEIAQVKGSDTKLSVKIKGEVKEVKAADFKFDNGLEVKEAKIVEAPKTEAPKASADEVFTYVELTTSKQEAGKTYKLTEFLGKAVDPAKAPSVVVPAVTTPQVTGVSATNLKQVVVSFNTAVDKSTASEEGNYSIKGAGNPVVDSAVVAEDGLSVTLNLVGTFENQTEYKLSLNNIKVGNQVLSAKDVAFKPLDNTVPTVAKVEALGNKTVRVSFSEPVKAAQTSHFLVDGKVVVGSIQTKGNTVILKLSSALTDGEHTLTAEGIQDYNNFKVVKAETKFNVVEDKTAPTVASVVSASFEKVVLKFSEPVEQVFASNVYWMQGAAKKTASSVKALSDDTYEFTFAGDNKIVYTTDLHVTNVKDYSGNVINKDTKVQVNPVIDQTRPEVISAAFVKDSNKEVVIKFTKSLDDASAKKAANYVIKDKDGKVQPISTTVKLSDNKKEVTITVLGALKDNSDYTLSVTGVSDDTTLKNVILPYTTTLSVKDVTAPELLTATRLNDKQIFVSFNEAMATSGDGSIVDADKYTITDGTGKKYTISSFNVTQNAKGVILSFNELPESGLTVQVQLVKDLAGNYLKGLHDSAPVGTQTPTSVQKVEATAVNKVEVTFSNPIQSLVQGDFTVDGSEIAYSELSADGLKATFTLKTDLPEDVKKATTSAKLTLTVKASPSTVDVLGSKIPGSTTNNIDDKVKATVKEIVAYGTSGQEIKITFNEAINITDAAAAATDFDVVDNVNGKNIVTATTAKVDADGKSVIVTLDKALISATVSAKDARFVKDTAGNVIADVDAETVQLGGNTSSALALQQ